MAKKRDSLVYLEPIEHKYHHKKSGEVFKSVTTVLSMLEPPFNSEEVALAIQNQDPSKKKEQYQNMSQEEILAEWKRINDEANVYGTEIHEILERYLLADKIYIPQNDYERKIISKFQEIDPMTTGTIYPETILFSEKYKLAGTSDIIEDCGDYFNVWDFKTNKKLRYISEYKHWLNKPVSHLSDCQYSVYSLQLSIYAYMYQQETKKKVGRMGLFYLNPETDKFELIPVIYLGREAKDVLDHWLEINNKKNK
jgi:hypothetical protein